MDIVCGWCGKKYDVPYAQMLKQVKDAGIPIPPSGYWTKVSFGKPVEKIELDPPEDRIVKLFKELRASRAKKQTTTKETVSEAAPQKEETKDKPMPNNSVSAERKAEQDISSFEPPKTFKEHGKTYNIYDRKTLYEEIWSAPVTEVAKKYCVSDVAIHKVCKALDIPSPPQGYWAKLRTGKPAKKPPLPASDKTSKTGVQTVSSTPYSEVKTDLKDIFGDDQDVIMAVASQILLRDENERLHPKIAAHKKRFSEWEAKEKTMREQRYNPRAIPAAPHHVCCASSACSPRVWRMVGTLISAMEPLGWEVTDDLDFVLNGDAVRLIFSESQDKINHIPTKEENLQLLKYQDDLRKRSYWATKPQIRKYDYEFNGKLYVTINGNKTFRDCKSYKLEDRFGDIMLEMYAAAEKEKQKRLACEEAERKRKEEERRQEERRKWYNAEVDRTNALANAAEDYALACKIRDYIAAYAHRASDTIKAKNSAIIFFILFFLSILCFIFNGVCLDNVPPNAIMFLSQTYYYKKLNATLLLIHEPFIFLPLQMTKRI